MIKIFFETERVAGLSRLAQEKEPPAERCPRIIENSALNDVKVVDKGVKHWLWCDALGEKDSNSFASLSLLTLTNQEVYLPLSSK